MARFFAGLMWLRNFGRRTHKHNFYKVRFLSPSCLRGDDHIVSNRQWISDHLKMGKNYIMTNL